MTESYVNARSSIMEIVAFEAARKEEEYEKTKFNYRKSYLGAFERFLKMIANIENIAIRHESFWERYGIKYQEMEQPSVPYVVDPSFPENNYLADMEPHVKKIFSRFANETLRRINRSRQGNPQVDIFENQPKWCDGSIPRVKKFKQGSWTTEKVKMDSNYVAIQFKEGHEISNRDYKESIKKLKKYLYPVTLKASATTSSNGGANREGSIQIPNEFEERVNTVREEFQQTISRDINGIRDQVWSPSFGQVHQIASVTFPLNDGQGNAIKISFAFE